MAAAQCRRCRASRPFTLVRIAFTDRVAAMMVMELRRQSPTLMRFAGRPWIATVAALVLLLAAPAPLHAEEAAARIDLTRHPVGYLALLIFFVAYGFVTVEEVIQMRKSKPVMLA